MHSPPCEHCAERDRQRARLGERLRSAELEVKRLQKRIEEQAAELRALRAITRPTYMSTESASVREHVPAILPDGRHTMQCICDGRGIVPGPIGGRAEKCPGPERYHTTRHQGGRHADR